MMLASLHNSRICQSVIFKNILPFHFKRVSSTTVASPNNEPDIATLLRQDLPKPYDGPERDLVNFPRRINVMDAGKVRLGFFPEEWFQFFYKKTGVTGPYLFGTGLLTFLLSKELYVIEEELSTGIALFIVLYTFHKKFGQRIKDALFNEYLREKQEAYDQKARNMKCFEDGIAMEKKSQWQMAGQLTLLEAKRENIHMQLEGEYRNRVMTVYDQVKKRLDYQMELQNTKRRLEHKHMVDWVISSVLKSITPQQEKEALQKCIQDLKMLSVAA